MQYYYYYYYYYYYICYSFCFDFTAKSTGKKIKLSCAGADEIIEIQSVTRNGVLDEETAVTEFRGMVQRECFEQAINAIKKNNGNKVTSYKCRNLRCVDKSEAKCLGFYEQFGLLELLLLIIITVSLPFPMIDVFTFLLSASSFLLLVLKVIA